MTEAAQPRLARGTKLTAGILVAALFAMLAFAPLASAAPDPVASGSAKLTLNHGWTRYLKTFGIKMQKIKPATANWKKATFKVTGGEMDPTNGLGTLNLSGGLKLKAGKKTAKVTKLVLDSGRSVLTAKVNGKKVRFAKLVGLHYARHGFGVNVKFKKLKLENAAATQLNKRLGFAKGKPKPFLKNKVIGNWFSKDQPSTVTLLPANNLVYNGDPTLLGKLGNVKVKVEPIAPTAMSGTSFVSPIGGGSVAPWTATAGTVLSSGGLKLVQTLPTSATTSIDTTITLGSMWADLSAKTLTVEVIAESNAEVGGKKPLDLGNLGRSSVADLTVTGVTTDASTRTVSVSAAGVLQPVSAEVLNGFVSVYKGYAEGVTLKTVVEKELGEGASKEKAEADGAAAAKAAGEEVAKNEIKSGEALGNFSFTGQAQ